MNRREFMEKLEYLLQDIPEAEKEDAVTYYRDYLEDAGDEREEEVIQEFGSPERIAAIIRADLGGNLKEGGEFTENGYQDERFRDPGYQVARRQNGMEDGVWQETSEEFWRKASDREKTDGFSKREYRRGFLAKGSPGARIAKWVLLLILVCMALPVFVGAGGGILGIVVGFLALFAALIALAGVLTVVAWIGAVALMVLGVGLLFSYPWCGIMVLGGGFFVLGLGFLCVAVCVLLYGKLIPYCICGAVNWLNHLLNRKRRNRI